MISDFESILIDTMAGIVEQKSGATDDHVIRTRIFMQIMLEAMVDADIYGDEMKGVCIQTASKASQLHDLGKISIDSNVLQKQGSLTDAEFELVKNHTAVGGEIIGNMMNKVPASKFLEYAKIIAESHHECWDGGGYHKGLVGEEIPILGRVMAIADVYDALVTKRPYKEAFSHTKAVEIIKNDGGVHFDPTLVQLFLQVHEKFEQIVNGASEN